MKGSTSPSWRSLRGEMSHSGKPLSSLILRGKRFAKHFIVFPIYCHSVLSPQLSIVPKSETNKMVSNLLARCRILTCMEPLRTLLLDSGRLKTHLMKSKRWGTETTELRNESYRLAGFRSVENTSRLITKSKELGTDNTKLGTEK